MGIASIQPVVDNYFALVKLPAVSPAEEAIKIPDAQAIHYRRSIETGHVPRDRH